MFGFFYTLFMYISYTINKVKTDITNIEARQKSLNDNNGIVFGNGKNFYNGVEAKYKIVDGHNCIVDNNNNVLKDYHNEKIVKMNNKNEREWISAIKKAEDSSAKYFYYYRYYKTYDFKDRPSGIYELSTCKRIHIIKSNNHYFKCYDCVYLNNNVRINSDGIIVSGYSVLADWKGNNTDQGLVEISETEWKLLNKLGLRDFDVKYDK